MAVKRELIYFNMLILESIIDKKIIITSSNYI